MKRSAKICWVGLAQNRPAFLDNVAVRNATCDLTAADFLKKSASFAELVLVIADATLPEKNAVAKVCKSAGLAFANYYIDATFERSADEKISQCEGELTFSGRTSISEILSVLKTCKIFRSQVSALQKQVEKLGAKSKVSDEINDEMQMAARLQRDFLPHRLPQIGRARFGAIYKPASFVSGDIYDVVRLDETHVGFYIADAVGHGMPAALLTMFIKKALQTKRITGNSYEIVSPEKSLAQLNADLSNQQLSMCEFCTAVYCVLNVKTLELSLARAGHPAPILISSDGTFRELSPAGPLLGVIEEAQFELMQTTLKPGDRLLLFSDGVEDMLCGKTGTSGESVGAIATALGDQPRDLFLTGLLGRINSAGPAHDDLTILLTDIIKPGLNL